MKFTELPIAKDALQRLLEETREALRKARFSVSQKQLKNIRIIRTQRKTLARILTKLHGNT